MRLRARRYPPDPCTVGLAGEKMFFLGEMEGSLLSPASSRQDLVAGTIDILATRNIRDKEEAKCAGPNRVIGFPILVSM